MCQNEVATFRAVNVPAESHFTWFLGLDTIKGDREDTVSTGYTKAGTYGIKLKIKLKNGDTCTLIKPKYLKVGEAPKSPSITVDKPSICDIKESVTITTTSTGMKSWTWNVGQILYKDSAASVTHKFIGTGFYDVSLTIQDSFDCTSTTRVDSLVLVERKPEVNLGIKDTSYCDTHSLFFFPKFNMYSQKGFSYDWTLNGSDIKNSTKQRPGKVFYNQAGTYGFNLTALSPANCLYKYTFEDDSIRIGVGVDFKIAKTSTAPCNSQQFTIEVTNDETLQVPLNWKFKGDSILVKITGPIAKVTYRKEGATPYDITHNHNGCKSVFKGQNMVQLSRTKALFDFDKYCSCSTPDTFKAINNSAGTSTLATYTWKVYDASNNLKFQSNDFEPVVELKDFGVYNVALYLEDTSGCKDSLVDFGTIRIEEPELSISASPKTVCIGGDVSFGIDSICKNDFRSASWRFFDDDMKLVGVSTDEYPIMSFSDEGKYSAELIYETGKCKDTVFKEDVFEVVGLQEIGFSLSDTIPCKGQVVNATLKIKPEGITPSVRWTIQHSTKGNVKYAAVPVFDQENEFIIKPEVTGLYEMKIVVDGGKGCIDSLEVSNLVKVSGVSADFVSDQTIGCLPFTANLSSSVNRNEHYGSPGDKSLSYKWRVLPEGNAVTIASPTSSRTAVEINESGSYNVFLTVENSDGCSSSTLKEDLFEFDFKAEFSIDTTTCQNIKIQPTNNTTGSNITYNWFCKSPEIEFWTLSTAKQPVFSFKAPGTYEVFVAAKTKDGCLDTARKTIKVHPYELSYSIENSEAKCTPAQYIFNIQSENVDTFIWSFGDGKSITTDQKAIAHVYDLSTVKPFRNEFKALLIGSNELGCIDTFFGGERLKVLGPDPTFKIDINEGCAPFKVTFTDSTEQVSRFYFNYGDGSTVDSVNFSQHVYTKTDTNKLFEVFKPYIIASDKNGCRVVYEPDDSILVYERSKPRFSAKEVEGCVPFTVPYINRSSYATQSIWDYKNLNKKQDTVWNGVTTYQAGVFSVKLVTSNAIGCKDSVVRDRYITATNPPIALFNASDTLSCLGAGVRFVDQTNAEHTLFKWNWTFTSDDVEVTSDVSNSLMLFSDTGWYDVLLKVTDINGCKDSLLKKRSLHIVERLPIGTPKLLRASVTDNERVELRWEKPRKLGFVELQIFEDNDFTTPVFSTFTPEETSTSITEPEVVNRSIDYTLKLVDKCDDPERIDATHSTIYLTVTRDEKPFANLNWNHYEGWDRIENYVIYRQREGEGLKEIKRVFYPENNYTDFSVCNEKYTYIILSVNPDNGSVVYSNSVEFDPNYDKPSDTLELQLATVENGNVRVTWTSKNIYNAQKYYIDRYDPYTGWRERLKETDDTFLLDSVVNVQRLHYKYRVWYRDFCGRKSPVSNDGSSILLTTNVSNDAYTFSWNPYEQWRRGIDKYLVELSYDLSKPFRTDTVFASDVLSFAKTKTSITKDSTFYMRVKAIEKGPLPDTSVSNIVRVDPEAIVHIPNAFSPNGDNVNDLLVFKGMGVGINQEEDYKFEIYNRWGERVFRSSNIGDFWDGTFGGEVCVEGVYAYYLRLRGVDNALYSYHGTVTLIK